MKPYRGSRKHVLDWIERDKFLGEIRQLLEPAPITIGQSALVMPRGYGDTREARLERDGYLFHPNSNAWTLLRDWWLIHKSGANTPNWDLVIGCEMEGRQGLILVEAKANWPELSTAGKSLSASASENSRENHERIGQAIDEARAGWQTLDPHVYIDRDSHYQLANRLAFTWKLASLGLPVVLLYLGFTGDYGISDAGTPFLDDADWQTAFNQYIEGVIPVSLLDQRLNVDSVPFWLVSRSRSVLEVSPPR